MKNGRLLYVTFLSTFFFFHQLFAFDVAPAATFSIGVNVDIKVFLKGPLIGSNSSSSVLMRDDLRKKNLIPLTEPYSAYMGSLHTPANGISEKIIDKAILDKTGSEAIVDWVLIELRDASQPTNVVATRAALLLRNSRVVDVDGESAVHFENTLAGNYYVAVRHRNHLGVMTSMALALDKTPFLLDFTNPGFSTYGTEAQTEFSGYMAMHAGDLNQDGHSVFMGPQNDIFYVFSKVMSVSENTNYAPNYILHGYHLTDLDLDGQVIFEGPGNERSKMLYHVLGDCLLQQQPNCAKMEQLPK